MRLFYTRIWVEMNEVEFERPLKGIGTEGKKLDI